jgi:hypothetical protein
MSLLLAFVLIAANLGTGDDLMTMDPHDLYQGFDVDGEPTASPMPGDDDGIMIAGILPASGATRLNEPHRMYSMIFNLPTRQKEDDREEKYQEVAAPPGDFDLSREGPGREGRRRRYALQEPLRRPLPGNR